MDFLTHLWMPIVLSAVAVWIVSAIGWMAIGHHNKDMAKMPNEKGFVDALKSLGIGPGVYGFPDWAECKKAKTPEEKAKVMQGPMGILRVWRPIGMGGNMVVTFVIHLVIGVFIAYLGWEALAHGPAGPNFQKVFQVLGTAGILAYCFGGMCGNIWYQESRRAMVLNFIDGVIYGLVTGAIFAYFWPHA
jgi:hypothetical protein